MIGVGVVGTVDGVRRSHGAVVHQSWAPLVAVVRGGHPLGSDSRNLIKAVYIIGH